MLRKEITHSKKAPKANRRGNSKIRRRTPIKMKENPGETGTTKIKSNKVLQVASRTNKIAVNNPTADKGRLVSLDPLNRLGPHSTRGTSLEGLANVVEVETRGGPGWL